ncbi:MAG: PD-(D/E)XK nuclease family transposase, partial [Parabacteroides sp.]|nr:PD-(D/E)XK nuclease family transposase [Parabacteroides sp.]
MEKDKFIDPKSDYGFKLLFGTVANKELTIGFLNSLLEKNIK